MRLLFVLSLALLSAGPTTPSASAQLPESSRSPVENCLAVAAQNHAAQRACVGRFTGSCIERDDANSSTPGMAACAHSEQLQWAEQRSRYELQLRARESETQRALLDAMLSEQERWVRARCAYSASFYEGGSLARYLNAACMRDMEAELALDLYRRLMDDF